jgi:hypothetical protein
MSFDPAAFRAASEAAESWFNTVFIVANAGRNGPEAVEVAYEGVVDMAYECRMPCEGNTDCNLLVECEQHAPVLGHVLKRLKALSDGAVTWGDDRGPRALYDNPENICTPGPVPTRPRCEVETQVAPRGPTGRAATPPV